MTTRLRDWVLLAAALAAVFGVSVHAPRPAGERMDFTPMRPGEAPGAVVDELIPRRPRVPRAPAPFPVVDPRPMLLYVR